MLYSFCYIFISFLFYSVLGYLVEIISCSIRAKKIIINRGFCLGPYLPIYGFCSLIMNFFLNHYQNDMITLFVMSAFVCTLMEYITSYVLEKIFKARWWDYSERKIHIAGRVCLDNACLFGFGGILIVRFIAPLVSGVLKSMHPKTLIVLGVILATIFFTDVIVTIVTMCQLKIASMNFLGRDATGEISRRVRGKLIKNKSLIRHMLNAFPKIDSKSGKDPLGRLKKELDKRHKKWKKKRKKMRKRT